MKAVVQTEFFRGQIYDSSLLIISHIVNLKNHLQTYTLVQDGTAEISPISQAVDILQDEMDKICMWGKTAILIGHADFTAQELHNLLVIIHKVRKIIDSAEEDRARIAKVYYPVDEDVLLAEIIDWIVRDSANLFTEIMYQKGITPSAEPGPCLPLIR